MLSTCKPRAARNSAVRRIRPYGWPRTIDPTYARHLGIALGGWMRDRGAETLLLGRDTRMISAELAAALQAGARTAGVQVFDAGTGTAPVRHFGARLLGTRTLVYVGSDVAPGASTAFIIEHDGVELDEDDIAQLQQRMLLPTHAAARPGGYTRADLGASYTSRVVCDVRLAAQPGLIVDGGNGAAGAFAAGVLRALGCSVTELFCDPDERYPNHLPEPSDPANLRELTYCLKYSDADFGAAFDADGERVTLVTRAGDVIGPDQQMILFARSMLAQQPGSTVVCDVQSSRHVVNAVRSAGGQPVHAAAGPGAVLARMRETGALLGGDAAGHICLRDRWSAGVDGIYLLVRLLELLGTEGQAMLATLPRSYATPPLRANAGNLDPMRVLASLAEGAAFRGAQSASDAQGVRVDFNDGFGSARRGWRPRDLVFRFEADTPQALDRIQTAFRRQIRRVAPRLQLPF